MTDTSTPAPSSITIEQLEALAAQLEADDNTERERLLRLCRAMARILAARQPEAFRRYPSEITDEAGHWDNSYPPKAELHYSRSTPRLIRVRKYTTEDVPTSTGFYHDYREQTTELGCYVGRDGSFWGCDRSGTAHFGQYAAHPGECNREIELDWQPIEPTLDDLREAEPILREAMAEFLNPQAAA